MIDADKTRLDAIYNRIAQLFEKTFPATAGWRPNIYVSHTRADTASCEYETLQMDYMSRAIMAAKDANLVASLRRGVHITDIMNDDTRIIREDATVRVNVKAAEFWLAEVTADLTFFETQIADARTNLGSALEALERFTQTVAERLARMNIKPDVIAFNLLMPQEQRQFEQMHTRRADMRLALSAALKDHDPYIHAIDIDTQTSELEHRVRARIRGNNTTVRIAHPTEELNRLQPDAVKPPVIAAPIAVQPVIEQPVKALPATPVAETVNHPTIAEALPVYAAAAPVVTTYAAIEPEPATPDMVEPAETAPAADTFVYADQPSAAVAENNSPFQDVHVKSLMEPQPQPAKGAFSLHAIQALLSEHLRDSKAS